MIFSKNKPDMEFDLFIKIALSIISLSIGTTLGILRSKFFSSKYAKTTYWSFFFAAGLILLIPAIGLFFYLYNGELVSNSGTIKHSEVAILGFSIISSIVLIFTIRKHLIVKDIFHTSELDPIVNEFTSIADRDQIKLFGGDLNFFGNTPSEMEKNNQYRHLRSLSFNKVLIICESPNSEKQRIRYGKILSDISGAELKFYHPDSADLRVRGRIIRIQGSDRLLIYGKIKSKTYRAIKTDTSDSHGALYKNIWDLAWSLASPPNDDEVSSYKTAFINYTS